ncbi:MAG: ATP-dependent DNA helicase RecG [Clostridia bacterium]
MEEKELEENVQFLKGVGPAKAVLLNKIGIYTIRDLLEYYPKQYEDRRNLTDISNFRNEEFVLFKAKICSEVKVKKIRNNLEVYSVVVTNNLSTIKMVWFNQTYLKDKLKENLEFIFYGKVISKYGKSTIENAIIYNTEELKKIQGIYPIYNLTSGITQNYLFKLISFIFETKPKIDEIFNLEFRNKFNLLDIALAMKNIHFPKTFEDINKARKRIIFEELFIMQLALMTMRNTMLCVKKETIYKDIDTQKLISLFPFNLTNAQVKVVKEIKNDMLSTTVMNRLVQGDVGSGKTIVAAIAMYIAVKNGYQVAMMAPTTILARQHYDELKKYFTKLEVKIDIITSSTTKKNKKIIIDKLINKEIDIVIGTHSLIEEDIIFNNLGLVITDEQHRFGVKQRMKLTQKGKNVETLVMSATPIPRTLAIILYGDLDVSIINEMPPGRKKVLTYAINDKFNERVNIFLKKQIDQGRQIYVVCPLVEDNEILELQSVQNVYEKYKNEEFKQYCIEYLHGKMKTKDKDEIMQRFKAGTIDILIATTVIEVGISVDNATVMLVEDADRFGLAALHQLRGRVGRSNIQSYCILKSKNYSIAARERLKIMEKSNDGFQIAQKDLQLRGPGDFFGIRQSGLPEFKLANLLTDISILSDTQKAAKELISKDKSLDKPENKTFKKLIYKKYGQVFKKADI